MSDFIVQYNYCVNRLTELRELYDILLTTNQELDYTPRFRLILVNKIDTLTALLENETYKNFNDEEDIEAFLDKRALKLC